MTEAAASAWPGWRGPGRDGLVAWLPATLPKSATFVWKTPLTNQGLGGIAATDRYVVVSDRDFADLFDVFRCLSAETGEQAWQIQHLAEGQLDYGNSPRATPLIHDDNVYSLGAFGDLHCVKLETGEILWTRNLITELQGVLPKWGMCSSPLIVDGKLIVNPGGKETAVVALDPMTGKLIWKCPGRPAGYASFIVGTLGGVRQIVGYDSRSLGGWDVASGKRLWEIVPSIPGDFNVPTPIQADDELLVSTENNGTRLYEFNPDGTIVPKPVAVHRRLAPDTSTPVVVNGLVFGCWKKSYCLDLRNGLREKWTGIDRVYRSYASLIATGQRILVTTLKGELLLLDADDAGYRVVSRLKLFDDGSEVHAHPAVVGRRFYVRNDTSIRRLDLDSQ